MKRLLLVLVVATITLSARPQNATSATAACNDEAIMRVKGNWKKRQDALMQPGNQSAVNSRIDQISKMFQAAYPSPRGIEAGWYRTMVNPLFSHGPIGYAYNSLYLAWYCNKSFNRMMPGTETGTWAYVFVNYFSWFLYDSLNFRVNGNKVYRLPEPIGEWKGYPLYDAPAHSGDGRCIVLLRKGEIPWKKISQQQYLESLRKNWVKHRDDATAVGVKTMEGYHKSIASIKNNQYIKSPEKEKIMAGLQKQVDEFQKRRAADSLKSTGYWNDKISVIDRYLSTTPATTLQQAARVSNKEIEDFKGSFATGPKTSEFVVVNTAYFNKQLPKQAPQLMVLYWRWSDNAPSHDFKQQIESNFPVEQLQAMIDK
jgi:hypothetical protein